MQDFFINIFVEDNAQALVIRKLFEDLFPESIDHFLITIKSGKGNIKRDYLSYKNSAKENFIFWICIDLDSGCLVTLKEKWNGEIDNPYCHLRIAVHEIEAWLMADQQNFARHFAISAKKIEPNIETISTPKEYLFGLIRDYGKDRFKREILPQRGSIEGPAYQSHLIEYIVYSWDYELARKNAPSLDKAIRSILNIKQHLLK